MPTQNIDIAMQQKKGEFPVFVRFNDFPEEVQNSKHCEYYVASAAKAVIGAESFRGLMVCEFSGKPGERPTLWKLFCWNQVARSTLVSEGIELKGTSVTIFDSNPFKNVNADGKEIDETKLIVSNIPPSFDENEIINELKRRNIKITSKLKQEYIRKPDGKLTADELGKRTVWIEVPDKPLPGKIQIGPILAKVYHREQKKCTNCLQFGHLARNCRNDTVCNFCKKEGHKEEDCVEFQEYKEMQAEEERKKREEEWRLEKERLEKIEHDKLMAEIEARRLEEEEAEKKREEERRQAEERKRIEEEKRKEEKEKRRLEEERRRAHEAEKRAEEKKKKEEEEKRKAEEEKRKAEEEKKRQEEKEKKAEEERREEERRKKEEEDSRENNMEVSENENDDVKNNDKPTEKKDTNLTEAEKEKLNTIIIDNEVFRLEKDINKVNNIALNKEYVISEENNNKFDNITSEHLCDEEQAAIISRPLTKCNVISEENNNKFDNITSEYFCGEGQATIPRRPLTRCNEVLEKFRRTRSNSIKRKLNHLNVEEPSNKKLNFV